MSNSPRIVALVKQVPRFEEMSLGPGGRINREGVELEMNPYCRRAVTTAHELAGEHGGESIVVTLGPAQAEDSLREAIACGVKRGVLLSDPACAGSDTLATAHALRSVLATLGDVDLILCGKNSVDADTGQVGPELAQLLDLPFAGPAKDLEVDFAQRTFRAQCETDDGSRIVEGPLPAVISAAERLCAPSKAPQDLRDEVDASQITKLTTADVEGDRWGFDASPTRVGDTRLIEHGRSPQMLSGPVEEQVVKATAMLGDRGVLDVDDESKGQVPAPGASEAHTAAAAGSANEVWAVAELSQPRMVAELAQAACRLSGELGASARVWLTGAGSEGMPALPAGLAGAVLFETAGDVADEDIAAALAALIASERPSVVILASTAPGREIASRIAATLDLGLTGDAVELDIVDGRLVAWKPAFGGQLVAAITSESDVQMATVRPGVLPIDETVPVADVPVERLRVSGSGRVTVSEREVTDDIEALAVADAVVAVGMGVDPGDYEALDDLVDVLRAELAATRKVTDRGWLPRSRQIGITGRAVAPRLFVSIGASGKFNHSVGFRAAHTVVAINPDERAPVFRHCDIGIVATWQDAVPLLVNALHA